MLDSRESLLKVLQSSADVCDIIQIQTVCQNSDSRKSSAAVAPVPANSSAVVAPVNTSQAAAPGPKQPPAATPVKAPAATPERPSPPIAAPVPAPSKALHVLFHLPSPPLRWQLLHKNIRQGCCNTLLQQAEAHVVRTPSMPAAWSGRTASGVQSCWPF